MNKFFSIILAIIGSIFALGTAIIGIMFLQYIESNHPIISLVIGVVDIILVGLFLGTISYFFFREVCNKEFVSRKNSEQEKER
ncbi:MAG: hypothetical protein AABY22_32700 [Nanoarchaeota archaeon]